MGYYDVSGRGRQQTRQGKEMQIIPQANVIAAASHVRGLFENKKFTYAIMGRLAMLCLGHRCEIRDVFIAYDDKDYNRIKKKLAADRRIQLPEGMNPLFPSKILVQTGPSFLDPGCTSPATIEVTLVPSGSYETPSNGTLAKNLVLLSLKTDGVLRTFYGLNMLYLVRTLLHFCQIRGLTWEPRKDIHFLCQHYRDQLQSIRSQLNSRFIERYFLRTAFISQLPFEEQRRCYKIILGREPPSTSALTPPAPVGNQIRSQSASGLPRSHGISRASLPDFLCPPESQKIKPSQTHTAQTVSTLAEHIGLSPKELSSPRDSRSRYRVVSAPNSRRISPTDPQSGPNSQVQPSYTKPLAKQASMPGLRSSRLHIVNPDGEVVSRTRRPAEMKDQTDNLRLVGPQGVHQASPTSRNPLPAAHEATTASQNPSLVFELDTISPRNNILAELSADIDAALQVSNHPCTSPPPALVQSRDMYRPCVPSTQPAPLNILPGSLTVGNAFPQLPSTPPHNNTPSAGPMTHTNGLRYSKLYSPPSSAQAPYNVPASPPLTPAPLSVFNAYQPNTALNSGQANPVSPPDNTGTEHGARSMSFVPVKDVDGMGHYFAAHDSQASQHVQEENQSLDPSKLALEYRTALPEFDEGYGGR